MAKHGAGFFVGRNDPMTRIPVAVGSIVGERYRVERVLGAGSMGVVVAAQHLELDATVAIKFLNPELGGEEACERFRREVRATAQLRGEHVARVLDVGELEDGSPFMVMDLLVGRSLADELSVRGALPVAEVVSYVLQACEALAEAHAAGIIHRDLKPANLFLARRADGSTSLKVIDFGVSKAIRECGAEVVGGLTRTGMVIGSPLYMPPEQLVATGSLDARADIWALGVVLFELLTTHTPYATASIAELYSMLLRDAPARPRQFRPELPLELEAIVMRCLEREPSARFQSVSELAEELTRFASTLTSTGDAALARSAPRPRPARAGDDDAQAASAASRGRDGSAPLEAAPKETGSTWQAAQRGETHGGARRFLVAVVALTLLGAAIVGVRLARQPAALEPEPGVTLDEASAVAPVAARTLPYAAEAAAPSAQAERSAVPAASAPLVTFATAAPPAASSAAPARPRVHESSVQPFRARETPPRAGADAARYHLPDFGGRR